MFKKSISAAVLAFTSPSESKSITDMKNDLESAINSLISGPKESATIAIANMLESSDDKDVSLEIDLNSLGEENRVFEAAGDS